MTEPNPGAVARIDQKLAGMLGELLAIAGRYSTGDLAVDAGDMSTALKDLPLKRGVLAEGVAVLALTLLRDRQDLFVLGPDRMPAVEGDKPPPGPLWQGPVDDVAARLVAGLRPSTGGTVARTPVALNTVYARAIDAISEVVAGAADVDHATRLQLIEGVLDAISKIEEDSARDHS